MQQELQNGQRINSGGDIIYDDPCPLGKAFQLTDRRRLQNVEPSEKYKASEQSFPRYRCEKQCNPLAGNLIDDDFLRVFDTGTSGELSRSRNPGPDHNKDETSENCGLQL